MTDGANNMGAATPAPDRNDATRAADIKARFPRLLHIGSFDPDIQKGEPLFVGDSVMIRDGKAYRTKPGEVWQGWIWTGFGVYHMDDEPVWDISL